MRLSPILLLPVLLHPSPVVAAFLVPPPTTTTPTLTTPMMPTTTSTTSDGTAASLRIIGSCFGRTPSSIIRLWAEPDQSPQENAKSEGPLDFLFNPYESKIPKEIEKEIYEAEGRTEAAKNRTQRVAIYAVITLIGISCAFFNAFITELRSGGGGDSVISDGAAALQPFDLETSDFGWVQSNFIFQFLFMNKIGGGLCLLGGAGAGLLAEAELDTRRINSEKIWEEMQKRRAAKERKGRTKSERRRKKKRRSGKEAKRLGALSEVAAASTQTQQEAATTNKSTGTSSVEQPVVIEETQEVPLTATTEVSNDDGGDGLLGSIKGFYEKADRMAQTQALMLNKKLEDEGLLEKITDESGFKVIGKQDSTRETDNGESSPSPKDVAGSTETSNK